MVNQSLIKITPELKTALIMQKIVDSESFEEVIWDLIEDRLEPSEETLKKLTKSRKQADEEKTISFEKLKAELNL